MDALVKIYEAQRFSKPVDVFDLEEQGENAMMRLRSTRKCLVMLFQPHTV